MQVNWGWVGGFVLALLVAAGAAVGVAARRDGQADTTRVGRVIDNSGGAAPPASTGTSTPSPAPTPTPEPTSPPPRSLLAEFQIVAYYGNPISPIMGILGEFDDPEELIRRLRDQAVKYQALNPDKKVKGALHLVYAVAQADAGDDGLYLYHMPDDVVESYIELTRRHDLLFFIDLQNGRADPVAEAARVQHWMRHEHVHLAVDPEFTMPPGEKPGVDLGTMDAEVVNRIQDVLQQTALDAKVANKILMVHQFQYSMLTNKENIKDLDRVDVVIDLDGWGTPPVKREKWEAIAVGQPNEHIAIKLFYRWDKPLMTEAEIQALRPRPHIVIYQ
jgi:hypothetical protein